MATTVLGIVVGGRSSFMALAWLPRANGRPPMIGICVNKAQGQGATCKGRKLGPP